jgi:hypothetical protein
MTIVASAILLFLGVAIVVIMLYQYLRGTVELLSLRNFFLLGFLVFVISSGVLSLWYEDSGNYPVNDWGRLGMIYAILSVLFIILFLSIYRAGFGMVRLASAFKMRTVQPGATAMLALSVAFVIAGGVLLLGVQVPYLGIIAIQVGSAFLAIAVALASWVWTPRLFNPVVAMVAVSVILTALLMLFMYSGFGRRDMMGLGAAFAWGAYFGHWRYLAFRKLFLRFTVVGTLAAMLLALVTTTRYMHGAEVVSAQQKIANLSEGSMSEGLYSLATGQGVGGYSMYFIETRPRSVGYNPLHSLQLFFALPIPRAIWPGKPDALGITSVKEIRAVGKPENWNIGPGLIGHIWNDFPYVALPLYALLFALFFRFADELIIRNITNPFVVIPMGASLGQLIAVPRGELGNFSAKMVAYMLGAWVAMQLVGRFVGMFTGSGSIFADQGSEADEWADDWDEWYDDVADEEYVEDAEPI